MLPLSSEEAFAQKLEIHHKKILAIKKIEREIRKAKRAAKKTI